MRTVLIAASLTIVSLWAGASIGSAETDSNREALRRWVPALACTVECYDGEAAGCPYPGHRAPDIGTTHEYGGGDHWDCYEGLCNVGVFNEDSVYVPEKHPSWSCGGGEDEESPIVSLAMLREAVLDEDVKLLLTLLTTVADHFEVNVERSAIQVIGCNDVVLGHVPISAVLVRSLIAD